MRPLAINISCTAHTGYTRFSTHIPEGQTLLDKDMAIPVLIEINPGRLGLPDSAAGLQQTRSDINNWISQGLHATIISQNILLGSQRVALQYDPAATQTELAYFRDLVVIPTGQDTLTRFTDDIEQFLSRMNEIPVTDLVQKLDQLLDQGSDTLDSVFALTSSGSDLISSERNIELVEQLTATLDSFGQLADSFSADSQTNQQILSMLQSISSLVEEFRPLITELRNRPNALIFPSSPAAESTPMRRSQ